MENLFVGFYYCSKLYKNSVIIFLVFIISYRGYPSIQLILHNGREPCILTGQQCATNNIENAQMESS